MGVHEAGQDGGDVLLVLQHAFLEQGVGLLGPNFLRKRLGVLAKQPGRLAHRLTIGRLAVLGVGLG